MRRGDDALTKDERLVLRLSARGHPTAEVAALADLPTARVRAILASAIDRLGARSKLEAVILAIRAGLIETEEGPCQSD